MVWSVMSDPLGLSIGTTNLVAARVGNQPVIRRSVLTLSTTAPESACPQHAHGVVLGGFVERVGDPVPLVAPDGSSHPADRLLVEALEAMVDASGGSRRPTSPSRCPRTGDRRPCGHCATRCGPTRTWPPTACPPRLVSDAVASLTALHANPGLAAAGCGGAAGFRWWRHEHHAGRRRGVVRADRRDHPVHRISPAIRSTRRC